MHGSMNINLIIFYSKL